MRTRARSVRWRLVLSATAVVAGLGVVLGVAVAGFLWAKGHERLRGFAEHEAEEIAHVVGDARTAAEVRSREEVFAGLFPEESVLGIAVWTPTGDPVYALGTPAPSPWPEGLREALLSGTAAGYLRLSEGKPAVRAALRVGPKESPRWVVLAVVDASGVGASVEEFATTFVPALLLLVSLCAAGSWWLVGRALEPVWSLTRDAARIAREGPGGRLEEPALGSELLELARFINAMLARVDESLGRLRRFASYAGHELRTPLARIRGEAERALRAGDPSAQQACLESVLEEVDGLRRLVDALLHLSREDPLDPEQEEPIDLATLADELCEQAAALGDERNNAVERTGAAELWVRGRRALLRSAIWNLLENALAASPEGAGVELALRRERDREAVLEVLDRGPGLPAETDPERFFLPFETARREGRGYGLGLALARSVARRHGGDLVYVRGERTCFRLVLPAATGFRARAASGSALA